VAALVLVGMSLGPGSRLHAQLVDRIVARVNGALVFFSDVRTAAGLGLVEAGPEAAQVHQMIQRRLLLTEVARFPPPEPPAADVAAELARMKARVPNLSMFLQSQELTDRQVEAMARDSLRIQAYLGQRFGGRAPVSDDVALEYYRAHPAEFTRDGVRQSFEDARALARERAAAARLRDAVDEWLRGLEARADIVLPPAP
jgi:hypothetical protein